LTVREILAEAMSLSRIPISDKDFLDNFNRAVFDIENKHDIAKRVVKRAVVCDDIREEYPLTDGCMGIQRVLTVDGYYTTRYIVRENNIMFDCKGVYFLYEKLPHERITAMNDKPTISPAYHYSIAKYIASKILERTDLDSSKSFMEDYILETEQMSASLRKSINTGRRIIKAPIHR